MIRSYHIRDKIIAARFWILGCMIKLNSGKGGEELAYILQYNSCPKLPEACRTLEKKPPTFFFILDSCDVPPGRGMATRGYRKVIGRTGSYHAIPLHFTNYH